MPLLREIIGTYGMASCFSFQAIVCCNYYLVLIQDTLVSSVYLLNFQKRSTVLIFGSCLKIFHKSL